MKTYETIKNLVDGCELTLESFNQEYDKVEAEIADVLIKSVKNKKIISTHDCGDGIVTEATGTTIDNIIITIAFQSGITKRFSLNHIITNGRFNRFADPEVIDTYNKVYSLHTELTKQKKDFAESARQLQKAAMQKAEAEKKAAERYEALKTKSIRDFDAMSKRAQASLTQDDDFYFALGWLAAHVGSVTAALPDYLEPAFVRHFGTDHNARVVDSKKRTCNGNSMQWTFGFKATLRKVDNIPSFLSQYLSSTGKAIANTSFIWDLVDNYGFKFSKTQDLEQIKRCIPNQYLVIFEEGLTA